MMKKDVNRAWPWVLGLLALGGCDDSSSSSGTCDVTPPTTWSAPEWDESTADALALRDQLDALVADTMRAAEEGTVTVDSIDDLTALYEAGDPSLASATSAGLSSVIDDAFEEFVELIAAGNTDLTDSDGKFVPGAAGGLFGSDARGIDEGGIEIRQIVDKGLFAGVFYDYAVGLTADPIDVTTIDAIAAAFGANAQLDPAGELADAANYSHAMGYYEGTAEALIAARAYATSPGCVAERDAAIQDFFRLWEEAMFARFGYYLNAAVEIAESAATDDDVAHAIHELSEGIGLAAGFYGLEDPASGPLSGGARVATDADIELMMSAIGVVLDDLGASTAGPLVMDPEAFGTARDQVEAAFTDAFELTPADLASWVTPTEG